MPSPAPLAAFDVRTATATTGTNCPPAQTAAQFDQNTPSTDKNSETMRGCWLWETDADFQLTFADSHAAHQLAAIFRTALHLDDASNLDKAAADPSMRTIARALISREPLNDVRIDYPAPGGARRAALISGRPVHGADGAFHGYRGGGSDLPLGHGALTRAERTESRLIEAIENNPTALAIFDAEGKLLLSNQNFRQFFFADRAEKVQPGVALDVLARNYIDRVGAERINDDLMAWLTSNLSDLEGHRQSRELILPDHRCLRAEDSALSDGGLLCVITDISDLRRRETELRAAKEAAELANRTKSQFLANVSHELRTPLNAIIGFAEILRDHLFGPLGNENYDSYVRDIHDSGIHLLELINDILDLSKAEAGQVELNESVLDLTRLIHASVRFVQDKAESENLTIAVDSTISLPAIHGDERRLKQILLNLLSNAVKFTNAGGDIRVSGTVDRDTITITVSDSGIGMEARELKSVMEPFIQIDSQLSRANRGTGLGLPLSNRLVELHGGRLELDSTPGKGTTVSVILPATRIVASGRPMEADDDPDIGDDEGKWVPIHSR